MTMNIVSAMMKEKGLRLSAWTGRWLYFDHTTEEWVVRDHKYRAKDSHEVYRGNIQDDAITALLKE
jgi:hypothetical protein